MELLRRFIHERKSFPVSYTVEELIVSLTTDGFHVSTSLRDDLERFGLVTGIVLAQDGNAGLRVDVDEHGTAGILLYNGLQRGNDPQSLLAQQKYNKRIITLR